MCNKSALAHLKMLTTKYWSPNYMSNICINKIWCWITYKSWYIIKPNHLTVWKQMINTKLNYSCYAAILETINLHSKKLTLAHLKMLQTIFFTNHIFNIYIYIVIHRQTFVLSELFSVARHVGRSKPGSKPVQLYVRLWFRPLGHQADHIG